MVTSTALETRIRLRSQTREFSRSCFDESFDLNACYELAMQLVEQAGKLMEPKTTVQAKSSPMELLVKTDQQIKDLLVNGIKGRFPEHKIIEKEASDKKVQLTDNPTWIIDPINGTVNFFHSFPHSAVSIALLVNKVTEIGIVYNPMLGQKFTARRGLGAYHNGQRIHVSQQRELSKAIIMFELEPEEVNTTMKNINNLMVKCHGLRCLGAPVLDICMVALGAAECAYNFGAFPWDYAASEFIVREAGGVTIDPSGNEFDVTSRLLLVANSKDMANQLSAELEQSYPSSTSS